MVFTRVMNDAVGNLVPYDFPAYLSHYLYSGRHRSKRPFTNQFGQTLRKVFLHLSLIMGLIDLRVCVVVSARCAEFGVELFHLLKQTWHDVLYDSACFLLVAIRELVRGRMTQKTRWYSQLWHHC